MKYSIIFKSLSLALLFVGSAGIMKAQQNSNPPQPRIKSGKHHVWQGKARGHRAILPGLTDDQKEQIKEIMLKTRNAVLPLENQVNEKRAHLRTLQTAAQVDMRAVNQTLDEIGALKIRIAKKRAASRQDIRSLLTDEQRIVFDSKTGHFMRRSKKHRRGPGGR